MVRTHPSLRLPTRTVGLTYSRGPREDHLGTVGKFCIDRRFTNSAIVSKHLTGEPDGE